MYRISNSDNVKQKKNKGIFLWKMSGFKDFHKLLGLTMTVKACEMNCVSKTAS